MNCLCSNFFWSLRRWYLLFRIFPGKGYTHQTRIGKTGWMGQRTCKYLFVLNEREFVYQVAMTPIRVWCEQRIGCFQGLAAETDSARETTPVKTPRYVPQQETLSRCLFWSAYLENCGKSPNVFVSTPSLQFPYFISVQTDKQYCSLVRDGVEKEVKCQCGNEYVSSVSSFICSSLFVRLLYTHYLPIVTNNGHFLTQIPCSSSFSRCQKYLQSFHVCR